MGGVVASSLVSKSKLNVRYNCSALSRQGCQGYINYLLQQPKLLANVGDVNQTSLRRAYGHGTNYKKKKTNLKNGLILIKIYSIDSIKYNISQRYPLWGLGWLGLIAYRTTKTLFHTYLVVLQHRLTVLYTLPPRCTLSHPMMGIFAAQ